MMVKGLVEATCKWKEEHDVEAQEGMNTAELTKRLSRAEEALKKTRAEWDTILHANEEI